MTLLKKKKRKIFRQCLENYFMLMASLEEQKVHEIHQTIGCLLVFRWILKQAVHHPTSFPPVSRLYTVVLLIPAVTWATSILYLYRYILLVLFPWTALTHAIISKSDSTVEVIKLPYRIVTHPNKDFQACSQGDGNASQLSLKPSKAMLRKYWVTLTSKS